MVQTQQRQLVPTAKDVAGAFEKKMEQVGVHAREREAVAFASEVGLPHMSLEKFPISQMALKQMTEEQVRALRAVCFYATPDEVKIGALDPRDEKVQEVLFQLEERNHAEGSLYVISEDSLRRALLLYKTLPIVKPVTKDVQVHAEDLARVEVEVSDFTSLQQALSKKTTTEVVTLLLGAALKLKASDIHVEAEADRVVIRFRLDGILHEGAILPKEAFLQLVSRVKLVSGLKMNIKNMPQDGRFTIKLSDGDVDVRVSTMPTVYGESIVMRLLRQSREGLTLEDLGLVGESYEKLKAEIERPNGMIITTGPTGSGKTTTMYAMLQILNKPGVKIITLEDPVEYRLEGINQSQIDHSKEYTFGKGLKSILRQDPDIAMIGEIRDLETADIAIQAALTGHLILSTIHTNSAAGAIPRFLAMGVKPFLLAPALNCVIGQRLVRRLCDLCKQKKEPTPETQARIQKIIDSMGEVARGKITSAPQVFYGQKGCAACSSIGYKGRVGIYEIFIMNSEIEKMILSGKISEDEIGQAVIAGGMVTMVQDGVLKALEGITSLEEVFRVTE